MHPNELIGVNRTDLWGVTCSGAGQTSRSSSVVNPRMPHAILNHLSLPKEGSGTVSPRMSNFSTGPGEHMKNCQCFPEPLKHNREAANSYMGTRKLSKTFKLLFFWEMTQI